MTLKIIVCVNQSGFIGKDNKLLYQIPQDMAYFKETTMGHTVIMGRKTWDSIPEKYRPLEGRKNIVVTNQNISIDDVQVMNNIQELFEYYKNSDEIAFVIGGSEIYYQALPYVSEIYITTVDDNKDGDSKFPDYLLEDWDITYESKTMSHNGLNFFFNILERRIKV